MKIKSNTSLLFVTGGILCVAVHSKGCGLQGTINRPPGLSEFDIFRLDAHPGVGFCPREGMVFSAEITRTDDGSFEATITTFTESVENSDDCPSLWEDFPAAALDCGILRQYGPRTLSEAEVDQMLAVFRRTSIIVSPDRITLNECSLWDPCVITVFTWDSTPANDFPCLGPYLIDEQSQDIVELLSQLARPAWLVDLIEREESQPVANPPAFVARYGYQGAVVYYLPPRCCDVPSVLYDADGNILCSPDGGFDGRGDGRCPDFFDERENEQIIWEDTRS